MTVQPSSPAALERLHDLLRRHFRDPNDVSRAEVIEATYEAYPITDAEREQIERAKAGDFSAMSTLDEHGNWVRL